MTATDIKAPSVEPYDERVSYESYSEDIDVVITLRYTGRYYFWSASCKILNEHWSTTGPSCGAESVQSRSVAILQAATEIATHAWLGSQDCNSERAQKAGNVLS